MDNLKTSDGRFKDGDACYYEFELGTVAEIRDGKIVAVVHNGLRTSSRDLTDRCFPVTPEVAAASAYVAKMFDELHALNFNSLNYPDLRWAYTQAWIAMCEATEAITLDYAKNQLTNVHKQIIRQVELLREKEFTMYFLGYDEPIHVKLIRR